MERSMPYETVAELGWYALTFAPIIATIWWPEPFVGCNCS